MLSYLCAQESLICHWLQVKFPKTSNVLCFDRCWRSLLPGDLKDFAYFEKGGCCTALWPSALRWSTCSLQSAFWSCHSTQSALMRVHNDIMISLDNRNSVILILLDLSPTFDTVNHDLLLFRLEKCFGINGTALAWFKSYLCSRTQFVSINLINETWLACRCTTALCSGTLIFVTYCSYFWCHPQLSF